MTLTVNIHEAKTHLSRLVKQASNGREFVIPGFSVDPLRLYQGLGRTVRLAGQTRRIGALAG